MRPGYKREVRAAMRGYDTSAVRRRLASLGYHRHVLEDEVHAYVLAGGDDVGQSAKALLPLRRELRAIYAAHAQELRIRRTRHARDSEKRDAR